jgi:hypothetical protein
MLQLHPRLRLALEPFWEGYGALHPDERNYVEEIVDVASLEQVIRELSARYNGAKSLDYQLLEKVYDHLLLRPDSRIIFLQRRNLLQACLSCHIAEQTRVWQIADMVDRGMCEPDHPKADRDGFRREMRELVRELSRPAMDRGVRSGARAPRSRKA